MKENLPHIIAILGPTASGKTGLGVKLAHWFNGEIVSADSRQVYKGMDIGTGKDLDEFTFEADGEKVEIKHHLLDVVDPKDEYNIARYQKDAYAAIDDILSRGKLPIIVGGSGLYLQAIIDGFVLSETPENRRLRDELEQKTTEELYFELKSLNEEFALSLNNSDRNNQRRLVRYVEIELSDNKPKESNPCYNCLVLGLTWPREILRERIYKRLVERFEKEGMIGEVERLNKEGVSWERLKRFGLEYKFISEYLLGELTYEEMVEKLNIAIGQFAKRQDTWFKRWEGQGREIKWVKGLDEASKEINNFI